MWKLFVNSDWSSYLSGNVVLTAISTLRTVLKNSRQLEGIQCGQTVSLNVNDLTQALFGVI
ncbi:hypothetical protein KIN20_035822 [Parelaphostrongylus tenuis]|uniref:Uncharacterized protein n=1 Tax=Parelaphostrongylus tenuis TaxID=148309 RepID=A0AAD5RCD4_PARTN|nr:hypothetical protein KIN20_035822 [Parelaphostrongylus tenuis]